MCGCLVAIVAMLSPRLATVLIWIFDTDRTSAAFGSFWVAALGWLFLPWTTLAWIVCYDPHPPGTGVTGFGWFVVIFAFAVDVMTHVGSAQARRRQSATA